MEGEQQKWDGMDSRHVMEENWEDLEMLCAQAAELKQRSG